MQVVENLLKDQNDQIELRGERQEPREGEETISCLWFTGLNFLGSYFKIFSEKNETVCACELKKTGIKHK